MIQNTEENIQKLNNYLEKNKNSNIDIVDVIKYIGNNNGTNFTDIKNLKRLQEVINLKKDESVLLVLVDGLGAYKVAGLEEESILRKNIKLPIKTVNPTSTACVLTSLCTASYPTEHGILGWWQYSKKLALNYYPLLFKGRKTEVDLSKKGIEPEQIYNFESVFDKFNVPVNIFMKREIINSNFSKFASGKKAHRYGCYSIKEGFTRINKKLIESRQKTFNYFYIAGLDSASHEYGIESVEVKRLIQDIEDGIKLVKADNPNLKIIIVADHGQVDMVSMMYLNQNYDFTKYFYAMPSIDTRMISFFVKEEFKEEFELKFCEYFNKDVILLTKEKARKLKLFSSDKFSENIENSIGEYIAIVVNNKFLICDKLVYDDYIFTKGNHSGLTQEETIIPLIVI